MPVVALDQPGEVLDIGIQLIVHDASLMRSRISARVIVGMVAPALRRRRVECSFALGIVGPLAPSRQKPEVACTSFR